MKSHYIFLTFRMVNLSSLSLSSHDRHSKPLITLVVLCWTFSTKLILLAQRSSKHRHHHPKRISAMLSRGFSSLNIWWCIFSQRSPGMFLAFFAASSWSAYPEWPQCPQSCSPSGHPSAFIGSRSCSPPRCRTLHLPSLNFMKSLSSCSSSLSRSFWLAMHPFRLAVTLPNFIIYIYLLKAHTLTGAINKDVKYYWPQCLCQGYSAPSRLFDTGHHTLNPVILSVFSPPCCLLF